MTEFIPCLRKSFRRCLSAVVLFLAVGFAAEAQSAADIRVTVHQKDRPIVALLDEIGRQCDCSFIIRDNDVRTEHKFSVDADNERLDTVLKRLLAGTELQYQIDGRKISIFRPEIKKNPSGGRNLRGIVTDEDGQPLVGAIVLFPNNPSAGT